MEVKGRNSTTKPPVFESSHVTLENLFSLFCLGLLICKTGKRFYFINSNMLSYFNFFKIGVHLTFQSYNPRHLAIAIIAIAIEIQLCEGFLLASSSKVKNASSIYFRLNEAQ